jgi:DNA (cytosine-5)-methyltransferase 1
MRYCVILGELVLFNLKEEGLINLNVLELFAGVGGFRVGLEKASPTLKTLWSNQFEPSRKSQDAFEVYNYHFPESENWNEDITTIPDERFSALKGKVNLIVGGFPCQDYSVARTKKDEKGIEGKKGVLFWEIIRATRLSQPKYLLLENVDRLLKAPSKQRGRDFAIMLRAFADLGYGVDWRVINPADYGWCQRRKRVSLFVYRKDTPYFKQQQVLDDFGVDTSGIFEETHETKAEVVKDRSSSFVLPEDIVEVSDSFSTQFWNSGSMIEGQVVTKELEPKYEGSRKVLGDILEDPSDLPNSFYLSEDKVDKFRYLRGAKKFERTNSEGFTYTYSEGAMSLVDSADLPSRTLLTSEGSIGRTTHLIEDSKGYRLLTALETERLQGFPDNWTAIKLSNGKEVAVSETRRKFFMGNALVVEVVESLGKYIADNL